MTGRGSWAEICLSFCLALAAVGGCGRGADETAGLGEEDRVGIAGGGGLASRSAGGGGRRVALVVGNGAYTETATLPNSLNDAEDMETALGRLGFEVKGVKDVARSELVKELRDFRRKSDGAAVSLLFYAGHGMEVDRVNYVVPVDARLERDTDVRYEAVALDDVLAATEGAGLRLVILDACRDNPLAQRMARRDPTRSISRGSFGELNESLLGGETLVAYAAAAGETAGDGDDRNSPYTSALLEYLEQPLELTALFRRVRSRVLEATGGLQRPHEYGALLGDHYLSGRRRPPAVEMVDSELGVVRAEQETVYWQSIADSTDPSDFESYLEQYPAGAFRALARNRLSALRSSAGEAGETVATAPAAEMSSRSEQAAATETALKLDRSARRAIQRGLAASDFEPGVADGIFGEGTREALRGWQATRGVAATGYLTEADASTLRAAAPPPPPEPPPEPEPVRVGGNIQAPTKVVNVDARYPPVAQAARVQGVVILEAVIGPDGRVTDVKVLRSVPLLDEAAIDAVRQWTYTPTFLDGVAVPVIMTVTVNFQLRY